MSRIANLLAMLKKPAKKVQPTGLESLESLVKAVVSEYQNDPSRPGVTISLLANGYYYASVVRYGKEYGQGKWTVCSANALTIERAVAALSEACPNRTDEGRSNSESDGDFLDDD